MRRTIWRHLPLVLPFIGLVCGPLYVRRSPELLGLPFFYLYELAWVPVMVALSWLVYRADREQPAQPLPVAAADEEPRFTRDPVRSRVRV
jgi:hypothetical protein